MEDSGTEVDGQAGGGAQAGQDQISSPAPGRKLGGYVLLAKLGAGGIGEVWKARDTRLNRVVALKFLTTERPGSSPARDLLREARAASALNHPNIVTVFEVGETAGSAFLAMEFVEGETLRARLKRSPLPPDEALEIAQQVVTGLAAAHRSGIIHRDLKPENIMLRVDGLVKLMDFGLAKVVPFGEAGTTAQATAGSSSGAIVGTLTYMSPEQARGHPVTPSSDVFSFGIILYEMMTGEHPFRAETAMDTLTAILTKKPASLNAKAPSAPAALGGVAARALEKEASLRFASATDLAAALKDAAAAPAVSAETAPPEPRIHHTPRWMQIVGAVLIAAILALAVWRWRAPTTGGGVAVPIQSVAVLNFSAATGDQAAASLAQELPEELGTALSKTGLQVASHASVVQLGATARPRDVGAQLGVDGVLDGNVRTAGSQLKVYVELANTRSGFMVWSDTFTVDPQAAINGDEKTAATIAQELRQAMAAQK